MQLQVGRTTAAEELNGRLERASDFWRRQARMLDARRFELPMSQRRRSAAAVAAVKTIRNGDGGYGWGLENDHAGRVERQPGRPPSTPSR